MHKIFKVGGRISVAEHETKFRLWLRLLGRFCVNRFSPFKINPDEGRIRLQNNRDMHEIREKCQYPICALKKLDRRHWRLGDFQQAVQHGM